MKNIDKISAAGLIRLNLVIRRTSEGGHIVTWGPHEVPVGHTTDIAVFFAARGVDVTIAVPRGGRKATVKRIVAAIKQASAKGLTLKFIRVVEYGPR